VESTILLIVVLICVVGFLLSRDSLKEKLSRLRSKITRVALYEIVEYIIVMPVGFYVTSILSSKDCGFLVIFLAILGIDALASYAGLLLCRADGGDWTFARERRHYVQAIMERSRAAGVVAYGFVLLKAIVWEGSEYVHEFYAREVEQGVVSGRALFIGVTVVHALLWTGVYVGGVTIFL